MRVDGADELGGGRSGWRTVDVKGRRDDGFVVEAVEVAAGFLEVGDPFVRLAKMLARMLSGLVSILTCI